MGELLLCHPEEEGLFEALDSSTVRNVPKEVKIRAVHLLRNVNRLYGRTFGFILILGYRRCWEKYLVEMGLTNHPFIDASIMDSSGLQTLVQGRRNDGAIIMDDYGKVIRTKIYVDIPVMKILRELGYWKSPFAIPKGTRHHTALAASYALSNASEGVCVVTSSEEDGSIRIFERGKILYSPLQKEMETMPIYRQATMEKFL